MPVSFWSDEQLDFIKDNFQTMTHEEMASKIGKTKDSVKKQCRQRGLIKKPHAVWTDDNIKFLNDNWQSMTYQQIGDKLGMSEKMVFLQAERQGFSKDIVIEIGEVFNRLTVIELPVIQTVGKQTKSFVKCECECGKITTPKLSDLINETTRSCGCLQKEIASKWMTELKTTHDGSRTKLYKNWVALKTNALKEELEFYTEWEDFLKFKDWANLNGYTESKTRFYRQDLNVGYNPNNCAIRGILK